MYQVHRRHELAAAFGIAIGDPEAAAVVDPAGLPEDARLVLAHRQARQEAVLAGDCGADRFALAEAIALDAPLDAGLAGLVFPARAHFRWVRRMIEFAWLEAEPPGAHDVPAGLEGRLVRWAAQQGAAWSSLTTYQRARLLVAGIRPEARR